jgi:hypothetical protein
MEYIAQVHRISIVQTAVLGLIAIKIAITIVEY